MGPHCFCRWCVVKLHQSLQASLLLKGSNLVDNPKGTEDQMQHLQRDGDIRLQGLEL